MRVDVEFETFEHGVWNVRMTVEHEGTRVMLMPISIEVESGRDMKPAVRELFGELRRRVNDEPTRHGSGSDWRTRIVGPPYRVERT